MKGELSVVDKDMSTFLCQNYGQELGVLAKRTSIDKHDKIITMRGRTW